MSGRQKFTMVEALIVAAILGILASIALPAMEQARRRTRTQQAAPAERSRARSADGQLNTIEVPELAQTHRESRPIRWVEVIAGLLPIAFAAVVIATLFRRLREHTTRRLGP